MSMRGKSINLFLMDSDPRERIKCTLANWTGVAYKIPRTALEKCKGRDDLSRSGVYFLFGVSDEVEEGVVYVGQAGVRKNGEGILSRLQDHKRDESKDYWTEAIVFTTSNNSFGPTEISYLENRFTHLATIAKRYQVKNSKEPTLGNITEEKESELEEFIDYAIILMGTLGYPVFESLIGTQIPKESTNVENKSDLLYIKRNIRRSNQTIEASCKQTAEGFVVLKGSRIELKDSDSIPQRIKEVRKRASTNEAGILQEDVLFKSPSYAAAFVVGGHANGLECWKNAEGKSLKEIENGDEFDE